MSIEHKRQFRFKIWIYASLLKDYLNENYISLIENPKDDGYYMPHHAVIKEVRLLKFG